MLEPLAIVLYERLMPGSQLVNRLQDLHYRILALSNPALLAATAKRESPLLVFVDLDTPGDICDPLPRWSRSSASPIRLALSISIASLRVEAFGIAIAWSKSSPTS